MNELSKIYPDDKRDCYHLVKEQLKGLLYDETYVIPNLSNTAALLNCALKDINWVGFYLMNQGELLLGPFQGNTACIHIAVGRGVCGAALKNDMTMRIADVHEFPGHIACDSASRSEIVIPIHHNGIIVGVLDIDSPSLSRFDEVDQEELETIVRMIETGCDWSKTAYNLEK